VLLYDAVDSDTSDAPRARHAVFLALGASFSTSLERCIALCRFLC
jgi:hypothetical protein